MRMLILKIIAVKFVMVSKAKKAKEKEIYTKFYPPILYVTNLFINRVLKIEK